jgi:NADPH:quinone reductase-like Zn-dependent oxidoreductase
MRSEPRGDAPGRRVVVHAAGGYDKLRLEAFVRARPGAGQVEVQVESTGINFADTLVRRGLYSSARELVGWPITPGFEVAGRVLALGPGVTDLAVGDEVFAVTLFNGYTSHLVVERRYVFPKPERLSFDQAAALPAVFMTAWYALHVLAHPRPGAKVLVHSAAGGVGGVVVQLAKRLGCEVVGVVGASHKVETVRDAGADHVIDKSAQALWTEAERFAPKGYDLILDANGVSTLGASYAHLKRPGKLVVYGFHSMLAQSGGGVGWPRLVWAWLRTPRFNPLDMTTQSRSVLAFNLSYLFDEVDLLAESMALLSTCLSQGAVAPPPVTPYPLDEVGRAHAELESGRTIGKLVLRPNDSP